MYQQPFYDSSQIAEGRAAEVGREPRSLPLVTSAVTLFADIVGYTGHCERLGPHDTFLLLAGFYERTSRAATLHSAAFVDHFGDETLAVWKGKAPLAVQGFRALRCGFAILVEMERWNASRARSGLPPVKAGIGIHAGPVLLGRPQRDEQSQPSVFGDTVNIASRLERQTRHLGTDMVISEELYRLVAGVAGDSAPLGCFPATVSVSLSGRARPLAVRPARLHQWSRQESA